MEYAFLAIAIVSEVIATSYLKQTEGFTKLTPSLICAAAYIVCHYTFAKSLNRINLNIGLSPRWFRFLHTRKNSPRLESSGLC